MKILEKLKPKNFLDIIRKKSWVISSSLFFVVLVLSVLVWWKNVLNPQETSGVHEKINQEKNVYENKIDRIKATVDLIEKRSQNLQSKSEIKIERDYFKEEQDFKQAGETETKEEQKKATIKVVQ